MLNASPGWCVSFVASLALGGAWSGDAAAAVEPEPLAASARQLHRQLVDLTLPYWHRTTVDAARGGFVLADNGRGGGRAVDKQLVSQTRMVWGFAHAHRMGLRAGDRDYLAAARQGYRFLVGQFLDREHGGYFWKTDLEGKPIVDCKFLYGEAFVIYAFVELSRATGDREPLDRALELFRVLQARLHDAAHRGWIEHTERDWRPLKPGDPRNEVEVVGLRSANAHLHWMEALAELYDATRNPVVRGALEEALDLNRQYFYPRDAGKSCFHRQPDWGEVTGPRSAGLSYGHNVEFAWLMIRAEQVLGREPSWAHFEAHLDHALQYGFDHERGGTYSRGVGNQPATDRSKVWWVQAEMLAALADAVRCRPQPRYRDALGKEVEFLLKHQINPLDGIWRDTLGADGAVLNPAKAHNWKANYHDVRGLVKFFEAVAPELVQSKAP